VILWQEDQPSRLRENNSTASIEGKTGFNQKETVVFTGSRAHSGLWDWEKIWGREPL